MTAFEEREATSGDDDGVGSDVATSPPASSSSSPSTYQKSPPEGEQSSSRHLTFRGDDFEGGSGGGKRVSTTSRTMIPLRAGRPIVGTGNNSKIPVAAAATLQGNVRETNAGSVAYRGQVLMLPSIYWTGKLRRSLG